MGENEKAHETMRSMHHKKRRPKEDVLEIVKQFINYFEEADRSESDGNRIKRGERF